MRKKINYKRLMSIIVIINLIFLGIPQKVFAATSTIKVLAPLTSLDETNLNGAVIDVKLGGDSFYDAATHTLVPNDFKLDNKPAGTNITLVTRVSNSEAKLTISFSGDFDTDITNFYITVNSSAVKSGVAIDSNTLTITAIDEKTTITYNNTSPLREDNLDGLQATVNLTGDTFMTTLQTTNFQPSITGLTVSSVQRVSDTQVILTLAFKGDFDTDKDLFIRTQGAALVRSTGNIDNADTTHVTVTAINETTNVTYDPSPLTEFNLNGAKATVDLSGDTFVTTLQTTDFQALNVSGLTISSVQRVSDTQVILTLTYNGTDIDKDISNLIISTQGTALVRSTGAIGDTNTTSEPITSEIETTNVTYDRTLTETNLDGACATIDLMYDTFMPTLSTANFQLINPVNSLSIARIERVNDIEVKLYLAYDGLDFDNDQTNFAIRTLQTALARNSSNIDSAPTTIYAVDETSPSAVATTRPYTLCENTLDGSTVRLTIRQNTFKATIFAYNLILNNAPSGTAIRRVTRINNNVADIELSYAGDDFDKDISGFSITILPGNLSSSMQLTSNQMTITALNDIEGLGNYSITGESFPTDIQIAGFNSRTNQLYINASLYTTKFQNTVFSYYINVFDNRGNPLGNLGDINSPLTASGSNTADVKNKVVQLNSALTNEHRIVVTVARTGTK